MITGETSARARHWDEVYRSKPAETVSWYRPHLDVSMALLEAGGLHPGSRVLDVGGGASTLVDDLLDRGVRELTVLDISAAALRVAQARLGERAQRVRWLVGDVTKIELTAAAFDLWHDRAVLHFLSSDADLVAYAAQAARAVRPGGYAVIGGFAPDGPERCSKLPVARRSPADIAAILGAQFVPVEERHERHRTPGGSEQPFAYLLSRRA